jgi:hypothetical protein
MLESLSFFSMEKKIKPAKKNEKKYQALHGLILRSKAQNNFIGADTKSQEAKKYPWCPVASGGQGAFLKNRPLDPRKTFYKPSALPTIDE